MRVEKRGTDLPSEMQGRWIVEDDPGSTLVVHGDEVTCFGVAVDYDYKEINMIEGALTVGLRVADAARQDDFARANITDLVITPEGEFLAYNVKFGIGLVREK
ncbi:hypothetical protein [Rhizobium sp.]